MARLLWEVHMSSCLIFGFTVAQNPESLTFAEAFVSVRIFSFSFL